MMATGVASPSAQGQLITSTAMACPSAVPAGTPSSSHTTSVTAAMPSTTGTNTPETLSASLAIGALVAAASSTMRMICDSAVSSPTRTAWQRTKPDWLMVAAETPSPTPLSTGTLSPVRADSLKALSPSSITPSTGTVSPGRTTNTSPTFTRSAGTVFSSPFTSRVAVRGASSISPRRASVVRPLERASSSLPTVMSVRIIAADSKYSPCRRCIAIIVSPASTSAERRNSCTVL